MFNMKENEEISSKFIKNLTQNSDILIQNSFGNYSIQHSFDVKIIIYIFKE